MTRVPAMALLSLLLCIGCDRDDADLSNVADGARADDVRTTDFQPGVPTTPVALTNPFRNSTEAIQQGERLFGWYNCAGCHGPLGGGGIGPPLRDESWIYGSSPAQIYMSIMQGRPEGMPAFGGKITIDQVWRIVSYIESLGGVGDDDTSGPQPKGGPTEEG